MALLGQQSISLIARALPVVCRDVSVSILFQPVLSQLTVCAHSFPQLECHGVGIQILLISRLNFYRIRANHLLDLPRLKTHLRFAHNLGLRTYKPCISSEPKFTSEVYINTYPATQQKQT
jgi:hypothetical protein